MAAGATATLDVGGSSVSYAPLASVDGVERLPYSLRILLENALRHGSENGVEAVARWEAQAEPSRELGFRPSRVLLQDFTGVPAIVDVAAMRSAMADLGGDPAKINPHIPAELVIDHSVQVDELTLAYLRLTGRPDERVRLVEAYCKENLLWHDESVEPEYSQVVELDLGSVEPSLAGPRRPQDRVPVAEAKESFVEALSSFGHGYGNGTIDRGVADTFPASDPASFQEPGPHVMDPETAGVATAERAHAHTATAELDGEQVELRDGSVVIAAITSCTNTSNPQVMVGAALLAKKAVERGLRRKPWVKSSLAPGSRVVTDYYDKAGLTRYLDELGFNTVGYGCTTCIGNSGPLPEPISAAVEEGDLVVCSVLSGNRNFEARIHPEVKANYLASPPLVVAYALAGRMDIDLVNEPLGQGSDGEDVFLRDIWPSRDEIDGVIGKSVKGETFSSTYADVFTGDERWRGLDPAG